MTSFKFAKESRRRRPRIVIFKFLASDGRDRADDQPHGQHDPEALPHQRQEQGDHRRMLRPVSALPGCRQHLLHLRHPRKYAQGCHPEVRRSAPARRHLSAVRCSGQFRLLNSALKGRLKLRLQDRSQQKR